ncbi:MAG: S8 family serine peptidase [Micrococcales bacterium]
MKNSRFIAVASAALVLLGLTASTAGANAAPLVSRVSFRDYAACGKAHVGTATCLAIRRTKFKNGVQQNALSPATDQTLGANALRRAYKITTVGARFKVIAIVDAMHSGTVFEDVTAYRKMYALPDITRCGNSGEALTTLPSGKDTCFVQMDQRGISTQSPKTTDQGWAQETALDVEMASAVCPKCSILLVEADTPSFKDLNAAVGVAAGFKGVISISNSYGGPDTPESRFTSYSQATASGIAVVASSGDSGYGVSAPASFSSVIGVGGTTLNTDSTFRWQSETAWTSGGSGCSSINPPAAWQDTNLTNCQGKSVVDVAAVADPATGVAVTIDGQWYTFGGTSAAAPIIAALFALKNNFGDSAGAYLWANRNSLHDVTLGSNGRCLTRTYCNSSQGYDGPTGWGTPSGTVAF